MAFTRNGTANTRWTSDEDAAVKKLAEEGYSYVEIANTLPGRTYNAVSHRMKLLGMSTPVVKRRRNPAELSAVRAIIRGGYERGLSISEISTKLVDEAGENLNNNQIIGRAHRMGLKHPKKKMPTAALALPAPGGPRDEGCHWVTSMSDIEVSYCGKPTYSKSWCEEHYHIVYVPASPDVG